MAIGKWISFSQPTSTPASDTPPPKPVPIPCTADGKQFGLENFGNTCYANSVLQALYFCSPFRDLVIQHIDPYPSPLSPPSHPPTSPGPPARRRPDQISQDPPLQNAASRSPASPAFSAPRTLFSALRALYLHISQNPADKGTIAPRGFIEKLRELNESFRNTMHHDAHEFLNYLLNRMVEEIEEERKQRLASGDDLPLSMSSSSTASHPKIMSASTSSSSASSSGATFVHQIFEGTLTSETRCLTCENLSSRDESFLDLSIDIEQNSSVTACLRQFSASEMLCQKEKFFCDACCDLQEAERRMKIKRLPNVLALHLKRFKYQEDVQKHIKLTYRVAFPLELRLFNTVDDIPNPDRLYELFAIVVHIGNGPNHGHYVSVIKTRGTWLIFDDDTVDSIRECDIPKYFGDSNSGSAYVLYYQAVDVDLPALGLRSPSPEPMVQPVPQSGPHHLLPTDSPVSTAQSIPSVPPGLTDGDLSNIDSVPEALPRPTTPPIPLPVEPPEKSPRKVPSHLFRVTLGRPATTGRKPSRNDTVIRPSPDDKFATVPRPTLSPITLFAKEDLKPLEGHSGAVNGKEKDSDRGMMGWFLRKSNKASKSRTSAEINHDADIPPLPQGVRAIPSSPVRDQSTSSSSNSSKDSRHTLDLPSPAHTSSRLSPVGRLSSHSRATVSSTHETDSRKSTASWCSHSTPASPHPEQRSRPRPLPAIPASPASPQTPKSDISSSLTGTGLDYHGRVQRPHGPSSSRGAGVPLSPKSPGRPSTSTSGPTKVRPSLLGTPSTGLLVPGSSIAMGRLDAKKDPVIERPKSAHASYSSALSPPTSPVPPLPVSATPSRRSATRKLSLSAPVLGFVRRDKDRHH